MAKQANKPKFTREVRTRINQQAKDIISRSEKLKRINPNLYKQMKIKVQDELIKNIARLTPRNAAVGKINVVKAAKIVRQKHIDTMKLYKKLLESGHTMSGIFRRIVDNAEKPTAEDLSEIAGYGFRYHVYRMQVWESLTHWWRDNSRKRAAAPYVMDAFNDYIKRKGIERTQKDRVEILQYLLDHMPSDLSWDVNTIEGLTEIKLVVDEVLDQIFIW